MTVRTALRTAAVATTGALVLLSASPVSAAVHHDDGDASGPGLSAVETLLIYVGIPAALFVVIALLVMAPSMAKGPRYRPGLGWWAAPVWFNGPDDADAAVRSASATPRNEGGGASARW